VNISAPGPLLADLTSTEKQLKQPDFFIVGAPKCATTSMHYYLKQHPEIFMSVPKEPFFFGSDLDSHQLKTQDKKEYLSFFRDARSETRIGESTVWYLYSKQAPREIKQFEPESRIIIMLRNPVDAMHAMHSQFLYSGNEPIEDFQEAVEAEPRRKRGENIHSAVYFPDGLLYTDVYSYASQVQRYFDTFGRDRVNVILLKDLKRDPEQCYENVLNFLEVNPFKPSNFESYNSNCQLKSEVLRELVRHVPGDTLGRLREFVPVQSCAGIWQKLKPLLVDNFNRNPIDPSFRKDLIDRFEPDINRLESIIGRDLSHWKTVN
jgi:hypothetical protein